jgi:imidazolonepropionase-like amidohydrolase
VVKLGRRGISQTRYQIAALVAVPVLVACHGQHPSASLASGERGRVAPAPIALVGGTLVNPGVPPVPNATVVFTDGRVACAGPAAQCQAPADAQRVDVTGRYVTPGLIDAHVHYSQTGWLDGRPDAGDLRAQFPYDSVIAALRDHPERFDRANLCSGVTSIFDVGGYDWTLERARRSENDLAAPRTAAAGPLLSTIDFWLNLPAERQFIYMGSDSAVVAGVRVNARLGAAAIKVWYIQVPDSVQPVMRDRIMLAGREAKRVGLPLIVHATELARAKEALAAGARVLVHDVDDAPVDSAFIAALRQNGAVLIPTLSVLRGYSDVLGGHSPAARYPLECVDGTTRAHLESLIPDSLRARAAPRLPRLDRIVAQSAANVHALWAAGITIAMGTDAGNPGTAHGPSVYAEMEDMQSTGMPAAAVFAAATAGSAQAMGRSRDLGSLEPGKLADAVVFSADPSADAANARTVRLVVRGGMLYDRSQLLPR